jgi:diguanylate cyclase (GGDEF)-like protein
MEKSTFNPPLATSRESMISLKKYLDAVKDDASSASEQEAEKLLPMAIAAYRSALQEVGNFSVGACPAIGEDIKLALAKLEVNLSSKITPDLLSSMEESVQNELLGWGSRAARHNQIKAREVKEILLVVARTAESVGHRDERFSVQIHAVTARLEKIGNLDDLTQIRASIEESAQALKTSINRMAEEGRATVEGLRLQVARYQVRLDEAEKVASRDSLTGLRNRPSLESQIRGRIDSGLPFCVAIIDIDGFKQVNDDNGHLVGDELLRQFSAELMSASRSTDIFGRWGGDEFVLVLDCQITEAMKQVERIREKACGGYSIQGGSRLHKLRVESSIGVTEYTQGDTLKGLVDRADAQMYLQKAASRARYGVTR